MTQERSPLLPDLPTAKEQGFDGIDGYYWMGFFFPKGTPEPIVQKLNAAINVTLDTPPVQARSARARDDGGGARSSLARLSAEVRRERDHEVGRHDQGQRDYSAIAGTRLIAACDDGFTLVRRC